MKKPVLIIVFLIAALGLGHGQEVSKGIQFFNEDGIVTGSLGLKTQLSGRLWLESKFSNTYEAYFKRVEIPVYIKFQINEKLSVFTGTKAEYVRLMPAGSTGTADAYGFGLESGVRYDFSNNMFGEIKYEHRFTDKNLELLPKNSVNLGFKVKF